MYRYFTKHAVPVLKMEWQNCLIKYIKITSSKYFHWLQGCPDLGPCHLFGYSWESTKITREPTQMLQQHGSMSTESRWPKVCFHSSHLSYKEIYSQNKYSLFVIVDIYWYIISGNLYKQVLLLLVHLFYVKEYVGKPFQ